jgi:hypothetical protein
VLDVTSARPTASETSAVADRGHAPVITPEPAPAALVGRLTPAWRVALTACWAGVFLAFSAVWKTSEEIGIGTWWLGPRSSPQPTLVRLLPFLLAIGIVLAVIANVRGVVWISLAGSLLIAVLALLDTSRSGGLAAIELAIAVSSALVALAELSGRYRRAPASARAPDAVADADTTDVAGEVTGDVTVTVVDGGAAR